MKVYFLKITPDNLAWLEDGKWTTGVIDWYSNSSYQNFSVVKSLYGFTPQRETWIGTTRLDTNTLLTWDDIYGLPENFETDSGEVINGRFIDKTGRIDIISFNVSEESSYVKLSVYHSDTDDDAFFEEEWDSKGPVSVSSEIALIDSERYGKLVFDFGDESPPPVFLAYIRIEIDSPVMMPLYRGTRQLIDNFPEWMAMAELPEEAATPEMATPSSLGGSFLNAIAGEWLDDIRRKLSYRDFQKYITTVDLTQMAWAWRTSKLPRFISSITGDGVELARTADQEEFRNAINDHACYIDYENDTLYTTQKYNELIINEEVFNQEPHHMWNYLDEIGLFVDLPRLYLESNEEYQVRIIDVYKNRGGVGVEQLKHALRRELSMWQYFDVYGDELDSATPADAATPDSDYEYALPHILDMEDLEAMNDPNDPRRYFDPDGMPTARFVELVERLSREYPTTWGRFSWGEAIWDLGGKDYAGYNITPYRYDADTLDDRYVQSGVGDGDDMFVFRPDVITGPREFEAQIISRGKEKVWRTEYPRVDFDLQIRGIGMQDVYDHPEKTVAFTLEVVTNEATPRVFVHSFTMTSKSDVGPLDFEDATPATPIASEASWATYELFSDDDTTSPEVEFRDIDTDELYEGTGVIPVEDIGEMRLVQGRWQAGSFDQVEIQDHFETWLSYDPGYVLTYNSLPLEFFFDDGATPATPSSDNDMIGSSIVMRSLQLADPIPAEWSSDPQQFKIQINGVAPYLASSSLVFEEIGAMINDGVIDWPSYVTDRFIELQIETTNSELEDDIDQATPNATPSGSEYGGLTRNENNETIFIPAALIQVDGDASWVEGRMLLSDVTGDVTISTASGPEYPIVFPVWEMREWTSSITESGVVDENGPWRNNTPPSPGNTNYNFQVLDNISRDDLGVPNSSDFLVTWVGVQTNNSRVLVWVDSNTVKPAIQNEFAINYPETAIEETIEDGTGDYYYSPIVLRARVRPEPDPQWNPQVHSGYFYDRNQEYYFYANKVVEETATDEIILNGVARQGAPIIIITDGATPELLRQVAFANMDATPLTLSTTNQEWVRGTGHPVLYTAYRDIYNITVEDEHGNNNITDATDSSTNEVEVTEATKFGSHYLVTYTVRNSYCVDYDYIENGEQFTHITFDSLPDSKYIVTYEGSAFDPATPVDLPLNPMYSVHNEGFIFISHNEYTLDSIRVSLSPANIIADGVDYMMITIDSMDSFGNPKPYQNFTLSTTFGILDETEVTTDHDGFAVIILTSEDEGATPSATPPESGTLTITGDVGATADFFVETPEAPEPTLAAVVKSEKIQADGFSQNLVFGRLESPDFQPIVGHTISWHKRRGLYELFTPDDLDNTVLELDGENGSYASVATSGSVNEDIEIIIDLHPYSWTGSPQTLVAQYVATGNQRSWQLRTTDTGGLLWSESADGISFVGGELIIAIPEGRRHRVKVVRDNATGTVDAFLEENGQWEHKGSYEGLIGPLFASTSDISVGAISNGIIHQWAGRVHSVSVSHNSVSIFSEDFGSATWDPGDEDITKGDWTLHGGAKIIQGLSGEVTTSQDGTFVVGPFTTTQAMESGYWFMAVEAEVDGVTVGDVVFWYEYPTAVMGVENVDGLPQLPVQMQIPVDEIPTYSKTVKYPTSYDEQATPPAEQDPEIQWLPPTWYAIAAWEQYQMGIKSHKTHKLM